MSDDFMALLAPNFAETAAFRSTDYTAGTIAADMGLDFLATDEPSERSRLLTHDPLDTWWSFYFGSRYFSDAPARTVSGLALGNVNLSRFGMYRFVGKSSGVVDPSTYREVLAPTALLAATNLSGAVTSVDESPRSPDGLWNTPTTPSVTWAGRWSFDTPAVVPAVGSAKQAFVVWARLFATTAPSQYPLLNCRLYESGVLVADLGTKVVTQTAGQTFIFRWDAALLGTASGANVEIELRGSAGLYHEELTGDGGPLNQVGVDPGAMAWYCEKSTPVPTYDSGWLASPFDGTSSLWGGTPADDTGPEPTKNLSFLPTAPWTIKGWAVFFSDDQADDTFSFGSGNMVDQTLVAAPDGYAQAGIRVAAPVFQPSKVNFQKGPFLAARDPSPVSHTLGGQEVGSRRRPRRAMPVAFPQLTETEGYDLFDRIDWRKGKKLPIMVIRYPKGSAATRRLTSVWATLEEMPGLSVPSAFERHSWSGLFVEKL